MLIFGNPEFSKSILSHLLNISSSKVQKVKIDHEINIESETLRVVHSDQPRMLTFDDKPFNLDSL